MNPSTEISPSTQLLLAEMRKLFDEHAAKWDRRFTEMDAAWDQRVLSRGDSVPIPAAAIGVDVAADNWGGLFDGDDAADGADLLTPSTASFIAAVPPAATLADNWGGLFEQPARVVEERVLDTAPASSSALVMPATAPPAATSINACSHKFFEPEIEQDAERSRALVACAKQERRAAIFRAEALGASSRIYFGYSHEHAAIALGAADARAVGVAGYASNFVPDAQVAEHGDHKQLPCDEIDADAGGREVEPEPPDPTSPIEQPASSTSSHLSAWAALIPTKELSNSPTKCSTQGRDHIECISASETTAPTCSSTMPLASTPTAEPTVCTAATAAAWPVMTVSSSSTDALVSPCVEDDTLAAAWTSPPMPACSSKGNGPGCHQASPVRKIFEGMLAQNPVQLMPVQTPPEQFRMEGNGVQLRPTPWLSFNMVRKYFDACYSGRVWKPPWPVLICQQIRCVLANLAVPWKHMMTPLTGHLLIYIWTYLAFKIKCSLLILVLPSNYLMQRKCGRIARFDYKSLSNGISISFWSLRSASSMVMIILSIFQYMATSFVSMESYINSRHLLYSMSLVLRCSMNVGFRRSIIHCEFSLQCWKDCIELVENTLQVAGFNRKVAVSLFRLSQGATLFISEASKLKWKWPMLNFWWSSWNFHSVTFMDRCIILFCYGTWSTWVVCFCKFAELFSVKARNRGLLHEPQHSHSEFITVLMRELKLWPLQLRIVMVVLDMDWGMLPPWPPSRDPTCQTSSTLGITYYGITLITSVSAQSVCLLPMHFALLWQHWWPAKPIGTFASQVTCHAILKLLKSSGGWCLDTMLWLQVLWAFNRTCTTVNSDSVLGFYLELHLDHTQHCWGALMRVYAQDSICPALQPIQFVWCPSSKIQRQLEGKPKLKEGGLTVYDLGLFYVAVLLKLTYRLLWDPGGSELVCHAHLECVALRIKLEGRSTYVEADLQERRSLGGFRAAAWGQAAFQGGRNVRELTGRSPERIWAVPAHLGQSTKGRPSCSGWGSIKQLFRT